MKKVIIFLTFIVISLSCKQETTTILPVLEKESINQMIDQWHQDVATFKYDAYFNKMTDNAVFVGTDAGEVWSKKEFQSFCKPFFEKKKTWDFKPINRNVYIEKNKNVAWFDETLTTWMGVCRGSGVVKKQDGNWKIQHYILSMTIPNEQVKEVIEVLKSGKIEAGSGKTEDR
jgi:ketosteroid isomerase-like protein